ncbi:MAG: 3-hydroxybutyryl-CoA dehydrogenase [candidate division Zixibacteria bacterium]|nr:3-hydroxybutyryl-CoA dehydrogenase [candidate division Zixibacteria bacterium]
MSELANVTVIGAGTMGSGIAHVFALGGFDVNLVDSSKDALEKALSSIKKNLAKQVKKETISTEEADISIARVGAETTIDSSINSQLVIEAVYEKKEVKEKILRELDSLCPSETVLATNTSSISISDLASCTNRSDKVIGMHFFNPVPIMKLVEVVRSIDTSDETFQTAIDFGKALGKKTVGAKDTPGFIVNVLLVPYLLDAVRQLENGLASAEEIDAAMVFGCGHPMGPLTLLDFVGLDTTLYIADIMYEEFKTVHYAAPPLLRRYVNAGYNGKKAGRGIYDYAAK